MYKTRGLKILGYVQTSKSSLLLLKKKKKKERKALTADRVSSVVFRGSCAAREGADATFNSRLSHVQYNYALYVEYV